MNDQSSEELKSRLREHTIEFSNWFNEASTKEALGILLDPADELKRINRLRDGNLSWRLSSLSEHRVSKGQVQTAVNAIAQSVASPGTQGFVIGGQQSEEASMALMMLFAIPVHQLRTNVTYVPLFMTTNRNAEQLRALEAMSEFINLYGDINIVSASGFEGDLREFAYNLAEEQYPGGDRVGSFMKSATVKLRPGRMADDVSAYSDRARKRGHEVMLIVEEARSPEIGENGKPERKTPCPLSRAMSELGEDFFSSDNKSFMVGFAEKPLANIPVGKSWTVNMEPVGDDNPTVDRSV